MTQADITIDRTDRYEAYANDGVGGSAEWTTDKRGPLPIARKISLRFDSRDQQRAWHPGEQREIKVLITNEGDQLYHGRLVLESGGMFAVIKQHPSEIKVFPQDYWRHNRANADGAVQGEVTLTIRAVEGSAATVGTHAVVLRIFHSDLTREAMPAQPGTDDAVHMLEFGEIGMARRVNDDSDWAEWTLLPVPLVTLGPAKSARPRGLTQAHYTLAVHNQGNVKAEVILHAAEDQAERIDASRRLRFIFSRRGQVPTATPRFLLAAGQSARFVLDVRALTPRLMGTDVARVFQVHLNQSADATRSSSFTHMAILTPLKVKLLMALLAVIALFALWQKMSPTPTGDIDVTVSPRQVVAGMKPVMVMINVLGSTDISTVTLKSLDQPGKMLPMDRVNNTFVYTFTDGLTETQRLDAIVTFSPTLGQVRSVVKHRPFEITVLQPTPMPTGAPDLPVIMTFAIEPNPSLAGQVITLTYAVSDGIVSTSTPIAVLTSSGTPSAFTTVTAPPPPSVTCEIEGIGTLPSCTGQVTTTVDIADGNRVFTLIATNSAGRSVRKVATLRLVPTSTPTPTPTMTPTPTPQPILSLLGGLDLDTVYCPYLGGRAIALRKNGEPEAANSWRCRLGENDVVIDFNAVCRMQYGSPFAEAHHADDYDLFSWKCYGPKQVTPMQTP